MAIFCLLAALALEQLRPAAPWLAPLLAGFRRYSLSVATSLNAGRRSQGVVGWLVAVVPWVLICLLVHVLLGVVSGIAAFGWNVLVLFLCLRWKPTSQALMVIFDSLERADPETARASLEALRGETLEGTEDRELAALAVETGITLACRELFGVCLWFALLPGPTGAVLYRLSSELQRAWGERRDEEFREFGRFARQAFWVLDWLPPRVAAVGFAVAGDFEGAAYCWRTQASAWPDPHQGVALAAGAGALAVRLGGPRKRGLELEYRAELGVGEWADSSSVHSANLLLWRTLLVWLAVVLLVTLAAWAGT